MMHPVFQYNGVAGNIEVTPCALVSGNELAIHMGLPRRSVCGFPVIEHAEFGREIVTYEGVGSRSGVTLGNIFNMGSECNNKVILNRNSLAMHTFITGSTGSGKSNTVYEVLRQLDNADVRFLVVEPAKGEYKHVFGGRKDVTVYGTNPMQAKLLQLNPFSFPDSVHVLEHIDKLIEILNACWPMYAAMPAVLKDAIEQVYVSLGWNMTTSSCVPREYPTFRDVMEALPSLVQQSNYSKDTQSDYIGALYTRVKSLTNGINGQIFCAEEEISEKDLFDKNVIVDLSRIGSMETKSLLMGILVMKLQEYRMSSKEMNQNLKHVTVLEEAHNILRKTSIDQSQESANVQGKSVEMISNAIAEMRTYGEGFIIADQAPGLMDESVIRNTNTKIIMRLPDESDRRLVGKAAGLNDDQIAELSKLPLGVAAVYQNNWLEPVLCKIGYFAGSETKYHYEPEMPKKNEIADRVCMYLAAGGERPVLGKEDVDSLQVWLKRTEQDQGTKVEFWNIVRGEAFVENKTRCRILYQLVKGKTLIENAERIMDPVKSRDAVDQKIITLLEVSKETAAKVRKQIFLYAANYKKETGFSYENLLEIGGIK